MKNKTIGLIGGMGPFASAYFYDLLLKKSRDNYGAKNNDDYPEIVINSVPVPDFISDTKNLDKARKMLISGVEKLNDFGVESIAMVCNTGHVLYDDLRSASKCEFISIVDLVTKKVIELGIKRVGILATPVTIKMGIYTEAFKNFGVEIVYPKTASQKYHEQLIRGMVHGSVTTSQVEKLDKLTTEFVKDNSLDGIVLSCTELPLFFPKHQSYQVVDCLDVLADSLLERYYKG